MSVQRYKYKTYPSANKVCLPAPEGNRLLSVKTAIERRRSIRQFSGKALELEELSLLLFAAQGITEPSRELRAVPSAGALYPIEVYLITNNIRGIKEGVYHYGVKSHELELIKPGNYSSKVREVWADQDLVQKASVCVVLTAVLKRTEKVYGKHAHQYALLEAGHVGQNIYLVSTSMGLGCCAVGPDPEDSDDSMERLLEVERGEREQALYLLAVGNVNS